MTNPVLVIRNWIGALRGIVAPVNQIRTWSFMRRAVSKLAIASITARASSHSLHFIAATIVAFLAWVPFAQAQNSHAKISAAASISRSDVQTHLAAENSRIIKAAEPFETLTEEAFSADPARIKKLSTEARLAGRRIRGILSPDAGKALDARLNDIKSAREHHDKYALAIACVEAYRILVTDATHSVVPVEVSLLDYAGFRYSAGQKADPPRWTDMDAAVDIAAEKWSAVVARVSDQKRSHRQFQLMRLRLETASYSRNNFGRSRSTSLKFSTLSAIAVARVASTTRVTIFLRPLKNCSCV